MLIKTLWQFVTCLFLFNQITVSILEVGTTTTASEMILGYCRFNMAGQCTCNKSGCDCSTSWGRALITGVSKEWVTGWCLCQWTTVQHNRRCWDARLVIRGEKCSYKTKQRARSAVFFSSLHQDMLNRRCSTADTQADWINKRHRSKEDCCVSQRSQTLPEQTRQWAGKYFAHPVLLCLICAGGVSYALLKNNLWSYTFFRKKGPVIINLQIESSQAFNHYRINLDLKSSAGRPTPPVPLICGWVSFHHFNKRYFPRI